MRLTLTVPQWLGLGFLASFVLRLWALYQTPYANGWDGYFYLIQVRSVFETGTMHSPEWTLYYPLLYLIIGLLGYATGIKVAAALLVACFTLAVMAIGLALKLKPPHHFPLLALLLFSPELTYFCAQWPKNLFGLVLFLFLIYFLVRKEQRASILFLVLNLFGHRLTAVLALLTFIIWMILSKLPKKHRSKFWMGLAIGLGVLFALQFMPGMLSIYDSERLLGLLSAQPQVPHLSFLSLFGSDRVSIFWKVELLISLVLFIGLHLRLVTRMTKKKWKSQEWVFCILLWILWFPFFQIDLAGVGYRLFHAGLILAMVIPVFLMDGLLIRYQPKLLQGVATVFVCLSIFSFRSYHPLSMDPPYAKYDKLLSRIESTQEAWGKPELVIAHKALAEYYTYSTQIDAMPWIPEYPVKALHRVAYLPMPQLARHYLGSRVVMISPSYGYLRETDWQEFLLTIKQRESAGVHALHTDWKNPDLIRPAYLLKK